MLRTPRSSRAALTALSVGALLASASSAFAQSAPARAPEHRWELLFSTGALVPTGVQRSVVKDAPLSTAQLSYVIRSRFAVTTMVGWARSRDIATAGDPKLDVFTYDVGAEVRAPRLIASETMSLAPFVGVGAGSRSYNYRRLDVDATHNLAGAGASATRNDVVALVGLRLTKRGS